jgi:putative nucleotidyltransferase with HDIG domain
MTNPSDNTPAVGVSRVLAVDDDPGILDALRRVLRIPGVELHLAHGPMEAMGKMQEIQAAVVISDHMMPVMTGVELLSLIRQNWPATVCIMMTACEDMRVAQDVINRQLVHFFVTKPWDSRALRELVQKALRVHEDLRAAAGPRAADLQKDIRENAGKAAFSLARAVDARDNYTRRHSENVAAYAQVVGRAMKLGPHQLEELRIGGLLHDVGKIGISDGILLKPGRLTEEEFQVIRQHPTIGESIVEPIAFPWNIAAIVGQHHENYDGSGYPRGLAQDQIVLSAHIIHVVDAYEAMSANRVYRTAREPSWILAEFNRCRGSQFSPAVVDVFLAEYQRGAIQAAEVGDG